MQCIVGDTAGSGSLFGRIVWLKDSAICPDWYTAMFLFRTFQLELWLVGSLK